jgi:hypothetical protein
MLPPTPSGATDVDTEGTAGSVGGGSKMSVPPLPSDEKLSVALKSENAKLAVWLPSVTVRRPVEALYDSAR